MHRLANTNYPCLMCVAFFLCYLPFPACAQGIDEGKVESMQKVIDQQQEEIEALKQSQKTQQQMLENLQSQLQYLLNDKVNESAEVAEAGEADTSPESRSEAPLAVAVEPAPEAVEPAPSVADVAAADEPGPGGQAKPRNRPINDHFLALDTRPLDIPDDKGFSSTPKTGTGCSGCTVQYAPWSPLTTGKIFTPMI